MQKAVNNPMMVSIMLPLLSEEEMDAMNSGDESDHDLISMEML